MRHGQSENFFDKLAKKMLTENVKSVTILVSTKEINNLWVSFH